MGTKIELDFETAVGITVALLKDDLQMVEEDLAKGKLHPEDLQIHTEVRDAIKTLLFKWFGQSQ